MSLESNKTLGGIGAILLAIPFANLIGIILILVAMKGMADFYNDEKIFKNTLYGFMFGIVGAIALSTVILILALGFATISPVVTPFAGPGLLIIAFIVTYVFSLTAAIFYNKSLNTLSEKSGEPMFNTGAMILLIGAIIPAIGELLKIVAWIIVAVGFFNINTSIRMSESITVLPATEEKRFCQYCGAQLQPDASFCSKCGKKTT
ncbi:DUF996 domain-containing protein [Candidatus Bathyarchaeota archaeon]|nr:DUF996 domain-containing protein [Candidatus Bathyarchaeota archaeon]